MKKVFWCYLITRRKHYLDTTVICTAAREEEIHMYNKQTSVATKIMKKLQEDLKEHYRDHNTQRDEYLLSKANLKSDTGEEVNATAIKDIKQAEQ